MIERLFDLVKRQKPSLRPRSQPNRDRQRDQRNASRQPRNSAASTSVATITNVTAVPLPLACRTTMPITRVHSQTRMPALMLSGSLRVQAVSASASRVPRANGHAVCSTP